MAERRTPSLLGFAITASMAVLPIMLGIVLLVALVRPSPLALHAAPHETAARYTSVRQVAALKTFEQAIVRQADAPVAAPHADDVLAGLPACRSEWAGAWRATGPAPAERIAAQLGGLDAALRAFSSRANARVDHAVSLDVARWYEAARAQMDATLESPAYPGQRFHLGCADLATALHTLSRADARMLEVLAWRGTEPARVLARWRDDQVVQIAPHQVARRNPWNGVAGCIYLADAHDGASRRFVGAGSAARVCALPAMAGASAAALPSSVPIATALAGEPGPDTAVDDPRWMVPPSLPAMLQPLESLRQPGGTLYRRYTEMPPTLVATAASAVPFAAPSVGANRVILDGTPVEAGFSIDLTIDPALQALAQKTAACYTGRQDVCRALDIHRAEDKALPIGHRLLETAMVRMAAVAVIDVASGRIEALAGALSPCTRQEFDGPGRDPHCDRRLPYPVQYRPDALLNPAVFHDAMPASTIKLIMASAFLADPEVGPRWLAAEHTPVRPGAAPATDSLRGQLMRSDSARFLDRMFCGDKHFADCGRPWQVQAMASAFGWNADCGEPHLECGKRDLLFGRALDAPAGDGATAPMAMPVAFGRLLSAPSAGGLGTPMHLAPRMALSPAIVSRCAAGADGRRRTDDDWEKCRGGAVVDVVAEGWGQGHARSSALGVAGMMATLAAAANGQAEVTRPHLVQAVRRAGLVEGAGTNTTLPGANQPESQPNRVAREAAQVMLDGLTYSHRFGTARTACEEVFDARACKRIDWIAGKTGTPSFPSDGLSLDQIAALCRGHAPARAHESACSSLRPYKWYVATYRASPGSTGPWAKAIAVLTERNWLEHSGQVHGAGDHGPNPSAEIAMQIVGRQLGAIHAATP